MRQKIDYHLKNLRLRKMKWQIGIGLVLPNQKISFISTRSFNDVIHDDEHETD